MDYFQDATTQRFTFVSYASGVSDTTFAVLRFKGLEAISTPYEFEIMLVSGDPDLDMAAILRSQAVFTIHRDAGDDVAYNGILAEFEQLHAYNEHYFYRAKLVPKIWWLMQTQHNQVFLDKTVPEIIEGALVDGGMDSLDYDLAGLEGTYNPVDYVCQYSESHFNFVSRWLEREGVYYYFYHDSEGDKLVLSDSSFSHEPFQQGADLVYSPKTGMEQGHLDEIIINFTCRQKQLPNRIVLKDHNPERPSLEMAVRADVDPDGRGESFLYGEHYNTPEEGERLIAFRVDELLCQKQAFHGDSTVPFLTPGFKFNMNEHYRSAFNQEYMVTSVTHEGDQTNLLKTSVIGSLSEDADINIYSNSFTAIPADRQYRHPRTADRPRISGTLHGKIDGEQDSPYAQLDEQGRYKVRLPFDINDEHIDGKASARVRMMQPYAGEGKGMQFPLTKGTEVLLTFIDGNPDRPVIAGAVSTETAPSPVNANNQSESVIRSAGNNRIRMEDKAGKERIVLQSPSSGSWIRVGQPNDPIKLVGSDPLLLDLGSTFDDPGAFAMVASNGRKPRFERANLEWVRKESEIDSPTTEYKDQPIDEEGIYIASYSHSGNVEADSTTTRRILAFDLSNNFHPFYHEVQLNTGVRINTNGSLWQEALDRHGRYVKGHPTSYDGPSEDSEGRSLIKGMIDTLTSYETKGVYAFKTDGKAFSEDDRTNQKTISDLAKTAEVKVSSMDTITMQEGNIFDFGGYWNYNLGNSYEEAWIEQGEKAKLNSKQDVDILKEGGPNWSEVIWPVATGSGIGSKNITAEETELDGSSEEDFEKGSWTAGNVWTTKEYGNKYDFHQGGSISVSDGDSLDISFKGHRNIELVLRRDDTGKPTIPAYYSHSESGTNEERKWNKEGHLIYEGSTIDYGWRVASDEKHYNREGSGGIQNHRIVSTTGMGTAEFEFDFSNVTSAKISSGTNLSFSMDMSASISAAVNLSASVSLTQKAVSVDIFTNGLSVEIDLIANKQKVSFPSGSANSYSGLKLIKQAEFEIGSGGVVKLVDDKVKIKNSTFTISNASIDMH